MEIDRADGGLRTRARRLVDADSGRGTRTGERDARTREAEEFPPGDLGFAHLETTSATLLSGSPSPSTAEANALIWSCDKSV